MKKNITSLLHAYIAIVLIALSGKTFAATQYFNNSAGGNFINNANWTPGPAPVNAGDVAIITNGATAYLTNGESVLNLGSLLLTNNGGGVFTMANPAVGTTTLAVSNVVVGGLGKTTNATLNILGGNFTNYTGNGFGGSFVVGNTAGSTGAVVIAGSSTVANFVGTNNAVGSTPANLYVGNAGVGTLTVSNGASVIFATNINLNIGAGSGANGSAAYLGGLGAASTITLNGINNGPSGIIVGQSGSSSNTLVITNATVSVTGSQESFYVGDNNSAAG